MNPVTECGRKDATNKLMNTRLEKLKQLQNHFLDQIPKEKIKLAEEIRIQKTFLSLLRSDYNRILKEVHVPSIDMESVEKRILQDDNIRELRRSNNFHLPRECPQEQKCSIHDTHNDVQKIEPSTSAPSTSAPSTSAPSTSAPSTSAPSTFAPPMNFNPWPQYNPNFFEMLSKK